MSTFIYKMKFQYRVVERKKQGFVVAKRVFTVFRSFFGSKWFHSKRLLDVWRAGDFTGVMRVACAFFCVLLLAGCGTTARTKAPPTLPTLSAHSDESPDFRVRGRVESVNRVAQFVVLSFPITSVVPPGVQVSVFREGLKVGILKVTGPQQDQNTIADIVTGDVQVNDEVREE
jgi:hypothetical protein